MISHHRTARATRMTFALCLVGACRSGDGATAAAPVVANVYDDARHVLLVGNSVSGTVSVIDAEALQQLGTIDAMPDRAQVQARFDADPAAALAYEFAKAAQVIEHFEPAAGERYVDDVFASPDGRVLYVSRSNLADVVALDLTQPGFPLLWRTPVDGIHADHAALSPDGSRLVVSVQGSGDGAEVLDTRTGAKVGSFATGTVAHQNDYTADGAFIYNSSIGVAVSALIPYADNASKGDRWLVKVDAHTLALERRWAFEYGIRPNVISDDQSTLYAQLSFLNGVIKYDLNASRELNRSVQPLSDFALATYATYDEFPHDSAHHGLALSGDGQWLCDCGTIDNTVTILATDDLRSVATIAVGMIPYWATTSADGQLCFVSLSGDDAVAVIEYASARLVAFVPTDHFPQRSQRATLPAAVVTLLAATHGRTR